MKTLMRYLFILDLDLVSQQLVFIKLGVLGTGKFLFILIDILCYHFFASIFFYYFILTSLGICNYFKTLLKIASFYISIVYLRLSPDYAKFFK